MEDMSVRNQRSAEPTKSRFTGLSAVLSIIACYGTLAFVSMLSFLGITINIDNGIWAGVITLFAWLAVAGVVGGFRRNHAAGPLIVATLGAVFITWVMFVSFNRFIEVAGFSGLIIATLWERSLKFPSRQTSV
jgi:hypothetical protein